MPDMITDKTMTGARNDNELVTASLGGDRDAFGQIVSRYQSLVCSLAYSATGSISQSEDLAQETFVTAWKQLVHLREPGKLRSWLCGIARNLIHSWLRSQGREPSHGAESLETISQSQSPEPQPIEYTIDKEEEAILWRALEQVPETYREPLVLFYREHQSIERVAENLELTQDAVKQRLARGRKMLHEHVIAFVERSLEHTAPGQAFTVGVLAALPALTLSAKAATLGATALKGTAAAKAAAASGIAGAILSPLLVIFGNYLGYRMNIDAARSAFEAQYIKSFYRKLIACIIGFGVAFGILMLVMIPLRQHRLLFASLIIVLAVAYCVVIVMLSMWSFRELKKIAAQHTAQGMTPAMLARPAWEYRSKESFLGLPLIHIRIGGGMKIQQRIVKAWIAVGDCAVGGLFAFGGLALAPFSIGGLAIGLLPFGGCALGGLAIGGLAIGALSYGGLAIGWQAFGGCALAWSAAYGGAAIAHEYAVGGFAHALHANDEIARSFQQRLPFLRYSQAVAPFSFLTNLIWVIPMLFWWKKIKRARVNQAPV